MNWTVRYQYFKKYLEFRKWLLHNVFFLRGKWREKILYPFCEIPEEKAFIKKWKLALVHNIPKWPDAFKNLAANGARLVKCIRPFFLHFISFSCENLKKKGVHWTLMFILKNATFIGITLEVKVKKKGRDSRHLTFHL